MNWFNLYIWENIYFLRYGTILFIIFSLNFIWTNNIYKIKEKIQNNLHLSENTKLYWQIFLKHFFEKKLLLVLFFIFTLILVFASLQDKSGLCSSLLGVTGSALVTVIFVDSINQYISEKKFLDISKEVRNTIYSLYYSFVDLVLILDKNNLSEDEKNNYRNSRNIIQDSINLSLYCEKISLKDNRELSTEESNYANYYLQKIKDDIELSILNIHNSSSNLEIYEILFLLNNLQKEFKHTNENFFTVRNDAFSNMFGGFNSSLLKNSLKQYNEVLKKLDNNNILNSLQLTYKRELFCQVLLPNLDELQQKE